MQSLGWSAKIARANWYQHFATNQQKRWLRIGTKLASGWPYTESQHEANTMTTTNSRSIHPQQRVSAMNLAPPNEMRRPIGVRRWAACIAKILLPAGLFAISLLGVINSPAQAAAPTAPPAQASAQSKLARDLQVGIALGTTPAVNWARDIRGARYVQVIIVSNSADPDMTDLRAFIVRTGRSVLAKHSFIHALTALMKAGTVIAVAQRN